MQRGGIHLPFFGSIQQKMGIEVAEQLRGLLPVGLRHSGFPERFRSTFEFAGIKDLRFDLKFVQHAF